MKKRIFLTASILFIAIFSIAQDPGWPRQLTNSGTVLILYTPQVEDWPNYTTLNFRMAFSLTPYQQKEVVGVVYITAATTVDTYTRMVSIFNIAVSDVHFPSLDEATAASMGQKVREFFDPTKTVTVSMDRIVAATPKKQTPTGASNIKNDPPTIYVSNNPAILLQLQGEAAVTDASKGGMKYVFNANWPLFQDPKSNMYYLFDGTEWQTSAQLQGPWTYTNKLPKTLTSLAKDENWTKVLQGAVPAPAKSSGFPMVFYSTSPAEIILFQGAPAMKSIPGTNLTYASNTSSYVFFSNQTSLYYFLTSGRWFSAPSLNGPWVYATPVLPADFANIPESSPAAAVLSAVPGTDQSADAVMIAQIPTKVDVDPKAVPPVTISYSGDPKFTVIEGTSLSYAQNTTDKVIMVGSNSYYACINALWYVSSTPQGPWVVATSIPQAIYTIPSSSPVYNVTYVTQTVTTTGTVEASYTAGYMGAFIVGVGVGMIIASGTGWYAPPYFYYPPVGFPICYGGMYTYGAYAYHPYGYGGVTYRASYNSYTGTYARSATAYGPYGSRTVGQAYNPYTGTMARGASVSTPYGTRSAGQAYNPYTGASAATRQGSGVNGQAGTSVYNNGHGTATQTAHATNSNGQTVAGARNTNGGKAMAASGPNGSGGVAKSANGDMYAAKDGNVYKNTGDGWNKYNGNGSWSPASSTKPATSSSAAARPAQTKSAGAPTPEISSAAQARSRGNAGASQWGGGSHEGGGWGGGGDRFGGGGGGFGGGGFGGGGFGGGGFRGRR
ncbi:MAG TPA: hypothetical protein VFI33_12890 [Puia sp.]|nr:hypothetical protein [Puia sp.]